MKPERMTILTVDDTPANIRLLMHYLEKQGYKVITAEDGFEGFKSAIQYKPDLILLDVMMPGTDGYEVCELLKAEEETKDIPVVFLTAKTDAEDKVRGFELGAVDYITKPFKLVEISTRVENLLQLKYYRKLTGLYQNLIKNLIPPASVGSLASGQEPGAPAKKEAPDPETRVLKRIQEYGSDLAYATGAIPANDFLEAIEDLVQNDPFKVVHFQADKNEDGVIVSGKIGDITQSLLNIIYNAVEINGGSGTFHASISQGPVPESLQVFIPAENQAYPFLNIGLEQKEPVEKVPVLSLDEKGFYLVDDQIEAGYGFTAASRTLKSLGGWLDLSCEAPSGFRASLFIPVKA
ncbi:response regulator [bacterium]|nr:response regulator [bacterium]